MHTTDAAIPDGAIFTNHRADGHGGAIYDVIRDGMILGVHTSERRDSTGIWIDACYWPHAEPVAIGRLIVYSTGATLRAATEAERNASIAAAAHDGGAGVITVDGVSCYVD